MSTKPFTRTCGDESFNPQQRAALAAAPESSGLSRSWRLALAAAWARKQAQQ